MGPFDTSPMAFQDPNGGGSTMSSSGVGGFGPLDQSQSIQRQMAPMREMRYMQAMSRMNSARPGRMSGGGESQFGLPSNGTDYSGYTYDPMLRQQAESYGVDPLTPDQVHPNAFLNSQFFNNHPRLASTLEGSIMGAAMTRGGMTIGDNISNVAQTAMGVNAAHHQMWAQQFAQPFQQQQTLETLHKGQMDNDYRQAQIDNMQDMSDHRADQDEIARMRADNSIQLGLMRRDASRPVNLGNGNLAMWDPVANSGQGGWNTQRDPDYVAPDKNAGKVPMDLIPYFRQQGVDDPTKATKGQWKKAQDSYVADQQRISYNRGFGGASGQHQAGFNDDTLLTNDEKNQKAAQKDLQAYNNKMGSFMTKQPRSFWARNGVDFKDDKAKQSWYKDKFPPPDAQAPTPVSPSGQGNAPPPSPMSYSMGAGSMVNSLGSPSPNAGPNIRKFNPTTGQLE